MSVPAHERLLDLIIALSQSRSALTRQQIRQNVNGYTPDDGDSRVTAAFERMFERDKEMLKELGIPLVTVHGTGHYDDIRYRIDLNEYSLPEVNLTPAELGTLRVASQVWDGSILARQARRGLTKLQGVASEIAEPVQVPHVRVEEPDEVLPQLFEALTESKVTVFTYQAASTGEETRRTVEPWQLLTRNQGWYLWAWDRGRSAPRLFRLSRVRSKIQTQEAPFSGPAARAFEPTTQSKSARVALRPHTGAALRARGTFVRSEAQWDIYDVPMVETVEFAGELCTYAADVQVLRPPELIDLVIKKLRGATTQQLGEA